MSRKNTPIRMVTLTPTSTGPIASQKAQHNDVFKPVVHRAIDGTILCVLMQKTYFASQVRLLIQFKYKQNELFSANNPEDSYARYNESSNPHDSYEDFNKIYLHSPYNGYDPQVVSMSVENLWGEWTECSLTCGAGHQTRVRECYEDSQEGSADDCDIGLQESETRRCYLGDCPQWGAWETWTKCSQTCNNGVRSRRRDCSGSERHFKLYVEQHFQAIGRPDLLCDGLETVR